MRKISFRSVFGFVMVIVIVLASVCVYRFTMAAPAVASDAEEKPQSLKVLGIGDTLTLDAYTHLYDAAKAYGIEEVIVGILYTSADTSVEAHKNNLTGAATPYNFVRMYEDGGEKQTESVSAKSAEYGLKAAGWDYISLQQSRTLSGQKTAYAPEVLSAIRDKIDSVMSDPLNLNGNADYQLGFLMTWADFGSAVLSAYGTQAQMYASIAEAVEEKAVLTDDGGVFDFIIPAGTAVQNMRTSFAGDSLNSGASRLGQGVGSYTAAAACLSAFTGGIDGLDYVPQNEDIAPFYLEAIIECVQNAAAQPFEVTDSAFTAAPFDFNAYRQFDCGLQAWGYWNASSPTHHFMRITQNDDCRYSIATERRFTIEDLPIGSVIEVKNGYAYRPEAWTGYAAQTTRKPYVFAKYYVITPQWWEGYEMRAFNVSTVITNAQVFDTNEGVDEYFKIYIPMSAENTITRLEAGPRVGRISGNTITVNLPYGTDITSVKVKVTTSGVCTVSPTTEQNWDLSSPVQITVTAQNGETAVYTLTAGIESGSDAEPEKKGGCGKSGSAAFGGLIAAASAVVLLVKKRQIIVN